MYRARQRSIRSEIFETPTRPGESGDRLVTTEHFERLPQRRSDGAAGDGQPDWRLSVLDRRDAGVLAGGNRRVVDGCGVPVDLRIPLFSGFEHSGKGSILADRLRPLLLVDHRLRAVEKVSEYVDVCECPGAFLDEGRDA